VFEIVNVGMPQELDVTNVELLFSDHLFVVQLSCSATANKVLSPQVQILADSLQYG
jgi:hypothetical protein